ncbi:nucleolar and coiled-body phosphoprotein 1-like [Mya arenaria]|uniref:nucleolar and coiled-body phosphoprotein 1-like n=1 Tax=Mya arenaria TaxID=6604 RepID=UPI0022E89937|nr:nucleolar and coiled-body phosphoprotein 1-like [Mya arenaria]
MTTAQNPRSQVLIASRFRSGSLGDSLDSPPHSPPPPPPKEPEVDIPNFPPVYNPPPSSAARVNKPGTVGSKVSRMKEIFQHSAASNDVPDHKFQPVRSFQHPVARAPATRAVPSALQPRSPPPANTRPSATGHMATRGKNKTAASDETGTVAPSSHVQRFNYTRALFARMEEEQKQQTDPHPPRRHSPTSRSPTVRSPVMSPERLAPARSLVDHSSGSEDDTRKKLRLSDVGDADEAPSWARRSRPEQRPPLPNRKPNLADKPKPALSEPNISKAVNSAVNETSSSLLWKRRQNDIMTDISNTDRYHESRLASNMSASTSQVETSRTDNESMNDDSVFSATNGSVSEDLSITSAYHSRKPHFPSDNLKFNQGRSASAEVLNTKTESKESEGGADKGGVVSRWPRSNSASASGKRLSRGEIQAAIEKADSYLRSTSSTEEEPAKSEPQSMTQSDISNIETQSKEPPQKMSQSDCTDSPGYGDSELKSWALYRKQRYARASDPLLEDKVGDINKLGSISDISVSGFRKTSAENLSKSPPDKSMSKSAMSKSADSLAAISQSSVLNRRPLRSQLQQQNPPTTNLSNGAPPSQSPDTIEGSEQFQTDSTVKSEINVSVTVSDAGINLKDSGEDSGIPTNVSNSIIHSSLDSAPMEAVPRPIPVPRRSAPSPPVEPPPPPPPAREPPAQPAPAARSSTEMIPPDSPTPVDEPESPMTSDSLAVEETEVEPVTGAGLASIPPVPGLDVQMRNKAHVVALEEPEESSDSESGDQINAR